jgi:serine/threonine protein kinase
METERLCPHCGALLPQDAPEGLCPKCLATAGLGTEPGATEPGPGESRKPPPSPHEIAHHFPQLEILEIVGQGGMGIVYRARQPKLDRLVALKILPLESGKDPAFAERFAREARALARLNHPNIVAVYDFGEASGLFYFLMEFVDGLNLRELEQSRKLTAEQALAIVPRICDALQFAHEEGIVHRDIKPGNILIDRKGRVKIADFGLAKILGTATPDLTLTGTGHLMGTPHYMAPEQIGRPQQVDHRADIYSLGVVFYEMLTGELPVGRFASPSQKVQVDVRLDDVVLRALESNPERRYQQASEVKTDVESITQNPPPKFVPPTTFPQIPSTPDASARAERLVNAPAIALTIYGIVNLVGLIVPLTFVLPRLMFGFNPPLSSTFPALPNASFIASVAPLLAAVSIAVSIAANICLLVGAARLRNLASYPWALAAALIAISPFGSTSLWLIGFAIGIWALIAMHQPEVKAAFDRDSSSARVAPRDSLNPLTANSIPIFSRKAIFGACLAVAPFALGFLWFAPLNVAFDPITPANFTFHIHRASPMFFELLIFPLLLAVAIATTILGITAIKDIRYSKGRIVGLPLALADAVFFPLLILDALVLICLAAILRGSGIYPFPPHLHSLGISSLLLVPSALGVVLFVSGLLLCAALDYLIVSACGRAARRPVNS